MTNTTGRRGVVEATTRLLAGEGRSDEQAHAGRRKLFHPKHSRERQLSEHRGPFDTKDPGRDPDVAEKSPRCHPKTYKKLDPWHNVPHECAEAEDLRLPPGFELEVWARDLPAVRSLALSDTA